jgi:hypothetical protein
MNKRLNSEGFLKLDAQIPWACDTGAIEAVELNNRLEKAEASIGVGGRSGQELIEHREKGSYSS